MPSGVPLTLMIVKLCTSTMNYEYGYWLTTWLFDVFGMALIALAFFGIVRLLISGYQAVAPKSKIPDPNI